MNSIQMGKVLLYLFLGITICFFLKHDSRKCVGCYKGILFGCLVYYSVIPTLVILLDSSSTLMYDSIIKTASWSNTFFSVLTVLVFVCVLHFATQGGRIRYNQYSNEPMSLNNEKRFQSLITFFVYFTFFIGGLALFIYVRAMGGVVSLLRYSSYLRSFHTTATEFMSYYASIMVIPARLITVTPIFSAYLICKIDRNRPLYISIFLISLLGSILFLLGNSGKSPIILFCLILLFPILDVKFNHPWRISLFLSVVFVPLLSFLDQLFELVSGNVSDITLDSYSSIFLNYIPAFAYPASSCLCRQEIVSQSYLRFFQDYITGFLNIIPGVNFSVPYQSVSAFYGGSDWIYHGGTPTDIITFGYLQLGIGGVMINAIILGKLCSKIDSVLENFECTSYANSIIKVSLTVGMFSIVSSADLQTIVRSQFTLSIPIICILLAYYSRIVFLKNGR